VTERGAAIARSFSAAFLALGEHAKTMPVPHAAEIARLQSERDRYHGELEQLMPLVSVLLDWDWTAIKEDGQLVVQCERQVIAAFAHVEVSKRGPGG
jgi:hypothetical protein